MDDTHANAIAKAILEPDHPARQERLQRQAREAAVLANRRRHAWFVLAGFAVGSGIGHFAFDRMVPYGLIGAFAGILASSAVWLLQSRRGS